MRTQVMVGGEKRFDLRRALLIYETESIDGTECFATVHPVLRGERGRPSVVGAGELVTTAFLASLVESLGEQVRPEILPEYVLARTTHMITWWTPAQRRPMFFRAASKLGSVSGKHFPLPALVWKVTGAELHVRALCGNARPAASTKLCRAPFWNTNKAGLVCQGSMRKPRRLSVETLREWEDAFFTAEFTHVFDQFGAGNDAIRGSGKEGVIALWRSLAGSRTARGTFPAHRLIEARETLAEFVQRGRDVEA